MSRRSRALRYYRSSKPRGPIHKTLSRLFKIVLTLFILYHLVFLFFIRSYSLETETMRPTFDKGDTLIATPLLYGASIPFVSKSLPAIRSPRRGDIVVIRKENGKSEWYTETLDLIVRFFTLQRVSLENNESVLSIPEVQVKRVIAVPGDTVRMKEYRTQIQTQGKNVFLDEREILRKEYELHIPEAASSADPDLPFSGSLPSFTLDKGEYLLLPDNRLAASGSENWDETPVESIESLVLFRYHLNF